MEGLAYNRRSILEQFDTTPTQDSHNAVESGGVKLVTDDLGNRITTTSTQMGLPPTWSNPGVYNVGDLVVNPLDNKIYASKINQVDQEWSNENWEETAILNNLESLILVQDSQPTTPTNKIWISESEQGSILLPTMDDLHSIITPNYDASSTYQVGDTVIFGGDYYTCNTAIEDPEIWNPSHWTKTSIQESIDHLKVCTGTITLSQDGWVEDSNSYYQVVTVTGANTTMYSKIDLQPDVVQINSLVTDGVQYMVVCNEDNIIKVYSIGNTPSSTMTIQCTVTEVKVNASVPIIVVPYLTFRERNGHEFDLYGHHIWDGTVEYSTDTENWETWEGESYTGSKVSSENGVLYLRGTGNTQISYVSGDSGYGFSFDSSDTIQIDCIGNIETLLDYTEVLAGNHPVMGESCFDGLFRECFSLCSPPELPAINLTDYCYRYMFINCTSLETAPELPATTLAEYCYESMFSYCTSLTTAPELPATTLAYYCYDSMFADTSITTAPELPATTLEPFCYSGMFAGTLITTAPELPATTLAENCYSSMFSGCTSLTTAPELPATTLANDCYRNMFYSCSGLTTAPELPATTLADYCYSGMFNGCTSLSVNTTRTSASQTEFRIPTSGTGTDAYDALTDMFDGTSGSLSGTPTINTTYYIG